MENQCGKLENSNQYFKHLSKKRREEPKVQVNSSKLQHLLKETENKLKAQEIKNVKMDQERSELKQALTRQREAATLMEEELKECKEKLSGYENKITELNNLVKELDSMKAKLVEYNNPSEELLDLRNRLARTSGWCDNLELEIDQLFLFAEHISENMNQHGGEDLGLLIHQMSLCARQAMFMLQPKMGTTVDYQRPDWLTKKLVLKAMQNAENKLKILSHEDTFRDRLEKRIKLIRNIALKPDSEDENSQNHHSDHECDPQDHHSDQECDPQDHHSDQEYENEVDDDEWNAQEAWEHTWDSSDEEE